MQVYDLGNKFSFQQCTKELEVAPQSHSGGTSANQRPYRTSRLENNFELDQKRNLLRNKMPTDSQRRRKFSIITKNEVENYEEVEEISFQMLTLNEFGSIEKVLLDREEMMLYLVLPQDQTLLFDLKTFSKVGCFNLSCEHPHTKMNFQWNYWKRLIKLILSCQ